MRTHPNSGNPVLGTAFISQSYVKIKWEWLIFLIVLEASSIIFLTATMIETKNAKMAILKSSSLVSMCALGEESKDYIGANESRGGVLKNALGLEVRLAKDGSNRWKLEREDSGAYLEEAQDRAVPDCKSLSSLPHARAEQCSAGAVTLDNSFISQVEK